MNIKIKKKLTKNWFLLLQDIYCKEILDLEKTIGKNKKNIKFIKKKWNKNLNKDEGGGESRIFQNGKIFEKVGVNFSEVYGKLNKQLKNNIPGAKQNPNFWASGISVVMHMKNPHIPAMHFNTRYIQTTQSWFGGGTDFTPCVNDQKEKNWIHKELKKMCDNHNKNYYLKYKKWCDKYFYINHRKETRGIGGLFFDYKKNNWEKDFLFVRNLGNLFKFIFTSIIKKKIKKKWSKQQKELQYIKRGRYVEFNLIYDRGTKFGLQTGGNIEAILMSMPPIAKWK